MRQPRTTETNSQGDCSTARLWPKQLYLLVKLWTSCTLIPQSLTPYLWAADTPIMRFARLKCSAHASSGARPIRTICRNILRWTERSCFFWLHPNAHVPEAYNQHTRGDTRSEQNDSPFEWQPFVRNNRLQSTKMVDGRSFPHADPNRGHVGPLPNL